MSACLLMTAVIPPVMAAEFRTFEGHGGPVMALSLSADGATLASAGFDNSVGLWSMTGDGVLWLDGHEAAVNVVTFLPGQRIASGGDDFSILVWDRATGMIMHELTGHRGKVMGLATDPDGRWLASASWDGSMGIWDLETGRLITLRNDHTAPVNAVAWSADGTRLYSAGGDGRVLEWDTVDFRVIRRLAAHGFGVNELVLDDPAGWLAYGALDGGTRVLSLEDGALLADLTADRRPILALARAPQGDRIAVGDGEGFIMVVETGAWRVTHDFRAALNGPVWALAFTGDGTGILAGGIADEVFLWPLDTEDPMPRMAEERRQFHVDPDSVPNGERQFLRKCSVCHALTGDRGRRAGPPLGGLFGRAAGTVEGYDYSEAIENSNIVWTADTIDALFDIGPDHYIPGTKMPMQQIAGAEDRADLIEFLKRETAVQRE